MSEVDLAELMIGDRVAGERSGVRQDPVVTGVGCKERTRRIEGDALRAAQRARGGAATEVASVGGKVIGLSEDQIGGAIGPFVATSILGDGAPQRIQLMFTTMTGISLFTALFTYMTHTRAQFKDQLNVR